MTTLLTILIVVAVVIFAIGFGCGWYVRGAYPPKPKKEPRFERIEGAWSKEKRQCFDCGKRSWNDPEVPGFACTENRPEFFAGDDGIPKACWVTDVGTRIPGAMGFGHD